MLWLTAVLPSLLHPCGVEFMECTQLHILMYLSGQQLNSGWSHSSVRSLRPWSRDPGFAAPWAWSKPLRERPLQLSDPQGCSQRSEVTFHWCAFIIYDERVAHTCRLHVCIHLLGLINVSRFKKAKQKKSALSNPYSTRCWLCSGHPECMEPLVQYGADVDVVIDQQGSPLHVACSNQHLSTVKKLLELGENILDMFCKCGSVQVNQLSVWHAAVCQCLGFFSLTQLIKMGMAQLNSSAVLLAPETYLSCSPPSF